jgi:hypothetical protein
MIGAASGRRSYVAWLQNAGVGAPLVALLA